MVIQLINSLDFIGKKAYNKYRIVWIHKKEVEAWLFQKKKLKIP